MYFDGLVLSSILAIGFPFASVAYVLFYYAFSFSDNFFPLSVLIAYLLEGIGRFLRQLSHIFDRNSPEPFLKPLQFLHADCY